MPINTQPNETINFHKFMSKHFKTDSMRGNCFGFSHMAMRAILQGMQGVAQFNQRANKINTLLSQNKLTDIFSSNDNQKPYDISAFFDGVELFQHIKRYPELYIGNISHQDAGAEIVTAILDKSLELEMQNNRIISGSGVYDKNHLQIFFSFLKKLMTQEKQTSTIPALMLKSTNHAICIGYLSEESKWLFFDINKSMSILLYDKIEDLAHNIVSSLSATSIAVFSYNLFLKGILPTDERAKPILTWNLAMRVVLFSNIQQKMMMQDSNGVSWLFIAAQDGQTEIVKSLCENGANINQASKLGLRPLQIAIFNGHSEITKFLSQKITDNNLQNQNLMLFVLLSLIEYTNNIQQLLQTNTNDGLKNKAHHTTKTLTGDDNHIKMNPLLQREPRISNKKIYHVRENSRTPAFWNEAILSKQLTHTAQKITYSAHTLCPN